MLRFLSTVALDLRDVRDVLSYFISSTIMPETNNPPIPRSSIELLDHSARDGNVEEFYSHFYNFIAQNQPLFQAQFNPNIYINILLSNIKIYDAKTVIGLQKLLECLNTIVIDTTTSLDIIEKISSIITTLDQTQLVSLEHYQNHPDFSHQITDRRHAIMQKEADDTVREVHGPNAPEEFFVVVGDAGE